MLTERELATLRAALRYWQEELGPHGFEAMRPYFDSPELEPLSAAEVEALRLALQPTRVRYALWQTGADLLASLQLFGTTAEAQQAGDAEHRLATVLLPTATATDHH